MLNPTDAGQGQLGLVLLLPFGRALPAGTHELLRLRFAVSPDAQGMSTQLLLGDYPASRDVSDATGHSLPADYEGAALDFSTTPLRISEALLEQGQLRFQTEGVTGKPVVIQGSPDMRTWQNVATNATGTGPISIPWSAADAVRYFRAMAP
jgi:hypothetical protein